MRTSALAQDAREGRARKQLAERGNDQTENGDCGQDRGRDGAQQSVLGPVGLVEAPRQEAQHCRYSHQGPDQQSELPADCRERDDASDSCRHRNDEPPDRAPLEDGLARQCARVDHAGDQDGDRRIERQHVMRQLRHHELKDEPRRHEPSQQESDRSLAPGAPDRRRRQCRERRARPEGHPE